MLISTSRRPGHRTRILCRELTRVLPNAIYVPRGAKTINKLASFASSLGHDRVMVVNSLAGQPRELRFLAVAKGWRWLDARVELGEIRLQRDLGQKTKLEGTKFYAEGQKARNLTNFLSELLGLPIVNELPNVGGIILITSDDELQLQFQLRPSSDAIGPVLQIASFGRLRGQSGAS
ncbi:MAG: hypothetical protein ACE5OT_03510 [Candidatus Hadarchaeaceae archaeon]